MIDPAAIAADVLRADRNAIAPPQRLKHGLTNESWLVTAGDAAVVVRLSNRQSDALQIDRDSEALVLRAVADAGIGAPVLCCDPERRLLVTQHLPGRTWSIRDARVPENVERLMRLLHALHALPPPSGVQRVDLRQVVTGYWNTLMSRGLSARVGSPKVRERAREFIATLDADADACLCHNDVHHLNVIDSHGRLRLVDWEYAGVGDPYFDLAGVCCYHAFSDASRRELLNAYLGHHSTAAFDRLQRMCWVFNYIRDLWFAVREME